MSQDKKLKWNDPCANPDCNHTIKGAGYRGQRGNYCTIGCRDKAEGKREIVLNNGVRLRTSSEIPKWCK